MHCRRYGAVLAKSRAQLGHILQRDIPAHMFIRIKQFFCPTLLDGNWQYLAAKSAICDCSCRTTVRFNRESILLCPIYARPLAIFSAAMPM